MTKVTLLMFGALPHFLYLMVLYDPSKCTPVPSLPFLALLKFT